MNEFKRLRLCKFLSQEDLAKKAEVSRVTISNLERGKTVPEMSTLRKLATALNVEEMALLKIFFDECVKQVEQD